MPIYRFETSNAYTTINADGYTIDRHGVATFTRNGQPVAVLHTWQTIVDTDAIHTGNNEAADDELTRPASGLPL